MKRFSIRSIAAGLTGALLVSTISIHTSIYANDAEADSAVAGIVTSLNSYYQSSEDPEADILEYLRPIVAAKQDSEEESSAASVNVSVGKTGKKNEETAAAVQMIEDGAEAEGTGLISVIGYLNIRKKPTTQAPIVGYIYNNSKVNIYRTVTGEDGDWYLVESDGVQGYVKAQYVLTGEAAVAAEASITNQTATVLADVLKVRDTASTDGNEVGTVYKDEQYAVVAIQGDFVKIMVNEELSGFVHKDYVRLDKAYTHAISLDNEEVQALLESYLTDIEDGMEICDQRIAENDVYGAEHAIIYVVELWGYYIADAENYGYTEIAEDGRAQLESAVARMNEVHQMVVDAEAQAAGNTGESTAAPIETTAANPVESSTAATQETSSQAASTEATQAQSQVVDIDAYYTGGQKYAGDMIYSSEIYLGVTYSDGTVVKVMDGWTSPDVGMILAESSSRVITVNYAGLTDRFELTVLPAQEASQPSSEAVPQTQPSTEPVTETQPSSETVPQTQPSSEPVTETQPSSETVPQTQPSTEPVTETQPSSETVPETQPSSEPVTETQLPSETVPQTQPTSETQTTTAAAVITQITASYSGSTKYAGDVIAASELYVVVTYSDGSTANVYEGWGCDMVGMLLSEGEQVITMTYQGFSSSFSLPVLPAATEAPSTTQAPETTTQAPETTTAPVVDNTISNLRSQIVSYACSWAGLCNYVWGGENLSVGGGVDCSGFTMLVYRNVAGVTLPHYSMAQMSYGVAISYEQLQPGDLVFYTNDNHVAIYIGNGTIVHAKSVGAGICYDSVFFKTPIGYRSILG